MCASEPQLDCYRGRNGVIVGRNGYSKTKVGVAMEAAQASVSREVVCGVVLLDPGLSAVERLCSYVGGVNWAFYTPIPCMLLGSVLRYRGARCLPVCEAVSWTIPLRVRRPSLSHLSIQIVSLHEFNQSPWAVQLGHDRLSNGRLRSANKKTTQSGRQSSRTS